MFWAVCIFETVPGCSSGSEKKLKVNHNVNFFSDSYERSQWSHFEPEWEHFHRQRGVAILKKLDRLAFEKFDII